jgi:hypothetical protein
MSGIQERAITEQAYLVCNAHTCETRYITPTYVVEARWSQRVEELAPAFEAGWRVYSGARSVYTYCPQHGPKVAMRQIYPRGGVS